MIRILLAIWLIQFYPMTSSGLMKDDLMGVWQADDKHVSDAYKDTYQFFQNGCFIFNFDQYINSGRRVLKLKGRYQIKGDTIGFIVDSTVELTGGKIERTIHKEPYGDEWSIVGGKIKTIHQNNSMWEYGVIKLNKTSDNKIESMTIDNRLYYKIKNSPTDYR